MFHKVNCFCLLIKLTIIYINQTYFDFHHLHSHSDIDSDLVVVLVVVAVFLLLFIRIHLPAIASRRSCNKALRIFGHIK